MSEPLVRQFVDLLYPPDEAPDGYLSLWEMPGKRSYHYRPQDPELEIAAHGLDRDGHNVFYGVGLRRADLGPYARGSNPDIVALPGFWADIDIRGINHVADNLPANIVEVVQGILQPFEWEPSAVINSGGGVHAYWLFNRPLAITQANRVEVDELSRAFQERLALGARTRGWKWDMTADLARVLRPVGTHNRKKEPQPVEFMGTPGATRYDYELFRKALQTRAGGVASILGRESRPIPTVAETPGPAATAPPTIDPRSEQTILDELNNKIRKNRKADRKSTLAKIVEGEPFAEPGDRDRMLQKVCSWIAFYDQVADPEILAEVLRPSLEAMAEMCPEGAMTFEDAVEKIARAQNDARRKSLGEHHAQQEIKKALIREVRGDFTPARNAAKVSPVTAIPAHSDDSPFDRPHVAAGAPALSLVEKLREGSDDTTAGAKGEAGGYSFDEINKFAEHQGELSGIEIPEAAWRKRWVILHGDSVYIHCNGRYKSPIPPRLFRVSAGRDIVPLLPEFDTAGRYYFSPQALKSDGSIRSKTSEEILDELATVARHLVADLSLNDSYYDPKSETFYEAVCPLRTDLEPRYDQNIQTWLEKLGGPHSKKLLDWIATVTYLDAPSCALFISGPPDAGKSLLANGLARLWHPGGYTRMDDVVGSFNADVASCPLVVADETLPEGPNGKPLSTKKLRDIISADTRPLRRKFMANAPLKGTIRCMLLANSEKMLDLGDETLGSESLAAVASRFLHIATSEASGEFVKSIGGRHGGTKDWVTGDLIARHALWLRDNQRVVPAGRFWVEGHVSAMHQMLATASTVNGQVVEWIVRHLTRPAAMVNATKGVLFGGGALFVNTNALVENWNEYIRNRMTVPASSKLNTALQGLSTAKETARIRTAVGQKRYWPIRVPTILEWAKETGVGDYDDLFEKIEGPKSWEAK